MELFKTKTNVNFLAYAPIALVFSAILMVGSIYIWFQKGDEKYGIDFRGGNEVIVKIEDAADGEKISSALEKKGLEGVTVQSFEMGSSEYSIRVGLISGMDTKAVMKKVEEGLSELHPGKFQIVKTDSVGATIGEELKNKALLAAFLGVLAVLIYMAFRFEFSYSLGAVLAMFHDVIFATGVYLLAGHDLNGSALAAALTITGYSVNDTIVIFDRVREELRKKKGADLAELMNESMNACLSRTIITSALTLFAVMALFVYGGGAIQDLSLFLLAGMVSGVYSTVYIASPIVLFWQKITAKKR